jgi:signal transduction histidine kinase
MADTINDLKQQLETLDNDPQADVRQKIDCLLALAKELKLVDPSSGLVYGQRAYDLSCSGPFSDDHHQHGIINSQLLLGILNYLQGNYRDALAHLFAVQSLAETSGEIQIEAEALVNIARIYNWLGDLPVALDIALKAIGKCKAAGYRQGEADAHNTIGIIHSKLDDHHQELVEFYQSLQLSREIGDITGEAMLLNDIAMAHLALSDYDNALMSAAQSLAIGEQKQLDMVEANILCTMGEIWLAKGDTDQALDYLQKSVAMSQRLGFKYVEMVATMTSGEVHLLRHEAAPALTFLHRALNIASNIGTKSEMSRCHALLSEVYKQQHDFGTALHHHEQFHAINEAVFNEESDQKIRNLQIIHDTETAQKEAEIYRLKNVELELEITERKQMEQQRLEIAMEREKSNILAQFVGDALHEFRTPLSILNINLYMLDMTVDDPRQNEFVRKIKLQSESILSLVETLVDMSKMDNGKALVFEATAINQIIDEILTSRQLALQHHTLSVDFVKDENLPQIQADVQKLSLALGSIVDNAIQHTPAKGTVSIHTYRDNQYIVAEIRDTGVGISEGDLPHIFERFWRKGAAHTTRGFGLGLPIAKQVIDRHWGQITVKSTPNQGSSFKIMLPIHANRPPNPNQAH